MMSNSNMYALRVSLGEGVSISSPEPLHHLHIIELNEAGQLMECLIVLEGGADHCAIS
jgi:hypothetical protein